MPSPSEGRIEIVRGEAAYRGSYLVKGDKVIVRFGNARASTPLEGAEPRGIAQKVLGELVDKAIAGKKPPADKRRSG